MRKSKEGDLGTQRTLIDNVGEKEDLGPGLGATDMGNTMANTT